MTCIIFILDDVCNGYTHTYAHCCAVALVSLHHIREGKAGNCHGTPRLCDMSVVHVSRTCGPSRMSNAKVPPSSLPCWMTFPAMCLPSSLVPTALVTPPTSSNVHQRFWCRAKSADRTFPICFGVKHLVWNVQNVHSTRLPPAVQKECIRCGFWYN